MIFFVKLQQLFLIPSLAKHTIEFPKSLNDLEFTDVTANSKNASAAAVFVAYIGAKSDGHQYVENAIQTGALVLVVEDIAKVPTDYPGLAIQVQNGKKVLSELAAQLYGHPSKKLTCFGVTGTNGKTSMTYLIEHFLSCEGQRVGVIGTVDHRVAEKKWPTELTTPDAPTLQKRLSEFLNEGARYAALEVSSHALEQERAADVQFDVVIFTNLTLDHLDYHQTMQNYFQAKQKLFTDLLWSSKKIPRFAIVNIDDEYGRKLRVADNTLIWTYGTNKSADFCYKIVRSTIEGTEFDLQIKNEKFLVKSPLIGLHNVANVVAALAAVTSIGVALRKGLKYVELFAGIPGRLQRVTESTKRIFVDYAHTPDALENTLKTVSGLKAGNKLITIFGCGGDRDKTKRPLMAAIAEKYSDQVIVTSDNPRSEDPLQIIDDIKAGFKNTTSIIIEADREKAIAQALRTATREDIVVIAGKGHEDYQILGTQKIFFSDYQIAIKYG